MLGECRGLFFFTTRTRGARGFHEGFCAFLRNFCAWRLPLWGGKHFFTTKFTQLTIRPLSFLLISAISAGNISRSLMTHSHLRKSQFFWALAFGFCLFILLLPSENNVRWCNGNTADFGSAFQGSNPCRTTFQTTKAL